MWVFNNLPRKQLKEKYGFEPTEAWIDHVMKSSVRFNSGGSGSFVSSNGLVLTNHHVGADTLHKVSTAEHDYYKEGFLAKTLADEKGAIDTFKAANIRISEPDAGAFRSVVLKEYESSGMTAKWKPGLLARIQNVK